jgi:hypothetical protein
MSTNNWLRGNKLNMKKTLLYIDTALILLILSYGCGPSKSAQDNASTPAIAWQRQPLIIDGSDEDWTKPLPGYDRKEQVGYAVSNDRDNLYIILAAKPGPEQRKILEGGLTVWINNKAEKSNGDAIGIGYPTGTRIGHDQSVMAAARPQDYQNKRPSLEDQLRPYSLYGFKKDETVENYDSGEANNEGVQVKISFSRPGDLIYEAMVPLSAVYPQNTSHNYIGKSVAVGYVIEGLPPGEGGRRGGGGGGSPISVGGGVGMGSFGSGMGLGLSIGSGAFGHGGGRGSNKQLYEQATIWQVAPLARPGNQR